MRSEGLHYWNRLKRSSPSEGAGIRVHISHIKTAGSQNWFKADAAVSMIEDAQKRGYR